MRRWFTGLVAGASIALLQACGTSTATSVNPNSPSASRCSVAASAQPASVGAPGGSGAVVVSTNRECAWEASSQNDWLSLGQSRSGQGDGSVTWAATPNPTVSERRGAIVVNGTRVEIGQAAAACVVGIDRSRTSVDAAGGRHDVAVTAQAGCAWSARSDAPWISIVAGANGNGDGTVGLQVAPNPSLQPRTGTLTIAGLVYTVDQAGAPTGGGEPVPPADPGCTLTVTPLSGSFAAEGGILEVTVAASAPACAWTAQSAAPWILLEGGVAERGSGQRRFHVTANTTAEARTGTVGVAGTVITVTQAAGNAPPPAPPPPTPAPPAPPPPSPPPAPEPQPCTLTVSPGTTAFPADGGSGEIAVTASAAACSWTAQAAVPWITLHVGTGTGSGPVRYTVATNPAQTPRSGTISVAGHAVTINQAAAPAPPPAPCTISVAPASASIPADGGSGEIAVTASAPTCTWAARSDDEWISVDRGNRAGSGSLVFTAAANAGAARTGRITIAGEVVTVTQAARPDQEVTLNGRIEGLTGSCPSVTFGLAGTTVVTSASTEYRPNESCGNLRNGRNARVRGRLQPNGTVIVLRVENISGGGDDDDTMPTPVR